MPSTAPTLTWQLTKIRFPAVLASAQSVLDTIALCAGDSTTWEVKSSAAGELELGPKAGSATPNLRVLIASGINAAQRQEPHDSTAVNANELWIGIAPDGGTLVDAHGSGDAYGAARWSLYWRFTPDITATEMSRIFMLTSDESCAIILQKDDSDTMYAAGAGAIFDPPDDSDGEGTPGRIYGMFATGRTAITTTFWSGGNDFMNSGTSGTGNVIGCFRPAATTKWTNLDHTTATGEGSSKSTTESGTLMGMPVMYYQTGVTTVGTPGASNPTNAIGVLRQIRKTTDGACREMVIDSAHAAKSYFVSAKLFAKNDAVSFDNG